MMNQYFPTKWAWLSRVVGVVAGVSALLLTASASQAQVLVTGFFNQVGTNFFYNLEVANNSGFDITLINVLFPTKQPPLVITGESAPPTYLLSYGSESLVFTGEAPVPFPNATTVRGFSLTSNRLLESSSVEAFDTGNNRVNASFVSVAAVPEAGTLPLIALAGSALLGTVIARRRNVTRP